MDQQDSVSHCKIIREGVLELIDAENVVILVEGKSIKLPRSKVDSTLKVDDVVVWDGARWSKKR